MACQALKGKQTNKLEQIGRCWISLNTFTLAVLMCYIVISNKTHRRSKYLWSIIKVQAFQSNGSCDLLKTDLFGSIKSPSEQRNQHL